MTENSKNNLFWFVFILLLISAISFSYYRIFIQEDFYIVSEVYCDPEIESCFEYTPEDLCEDDIECIDDLLPEDYFYKIIYKKAYSVEECNPTLLEEDEYCPDLECEEGESEKVCYYEYYE